MEGRLRLFSRTLPGATLISVEGELDTVVAEQLDAYIRRVRQSAGDHLVFDLSEVRLLDSAGLRVITRTHTYAREHGGSVRLAGLQPLVEEVIRVVRIDRYIPVHDTATDALHAALTDPRPPSVAGEATGA